MLNNMYIILSSFFLIFPLIYLIFYKDNMYSLKNNKVLYNFLKLFLVFLSLYLAFQLISKLIFSPDTMFYFAFVLFLIALLFLIRFTMDEIDRKFYYLNTILVLVIIVFSIIHFFFNNTLIIIDTPLSDLSLIILITIIIASILPILILLGLRAYYSRKSLELEISVKNLKTIILYFMIIIVIFFTISLVSYFTIFDANIIFSAQAGFEEVGGIIDIIILSVTTDPLFVFTAIFTMFGAVIRTFGIMAFRMFGNVVMAFMPMFAWLMYFFGNIPDPIIALFGDFEWFARVFYIILTTMLFVIILSAWNLFSGITAMIRAG